MDSKDYTEYKVQLWTTLKSWRPRILLMEKNGFFIKKPKESKLFKASDKVFFPLHNVKIVDVSQVTKEKITHQTELEFNVVSSDETKFFRAETKELKYEIIKVLNEIINNVNVQSAFSNEYQKYKTEIAKQQVHSPFEAITVRITHYQNLFLEMNKKIDFFGKTINEGGKIKKDVLINIHSNLKTIGVEMKKQFNEIIEKIYDYQEAMTGEKSKSIISVSLPKKIIDSDEEHTINYSDSHDETENKEEETRGKDEKKKKDKEESIKEDKKEEGKKEEDKKEEVKKEEVKKEEVKKEEIKKEEEDKKEEVKKEEDKEKDKKEEENKTPQNTEKIHEKEDEKVLEGKIKTVDSITSNKKINITSIKPQSDRPSPSPEIPKPTGDFCDTIGELNNSSVSETNINNKQVEKAEQSEPPKNPIQTLTTFLSSKAYPDYNDQYYSHPPREKIPNDIKCGGNMIKEFIKSMSSKKPSLPIYFNEPISMLQKQCEKFFFSELLNKAAEESNHQKQLLNISAFIIGEIFLNLSRMLKPFNPILGETFEFFDNERSYRYFSEQVSHNPPITAFIAESSHFAFFGDSRASTSFKFLKGCFEVEFKNKLHVLLKDNNDYYVFNRPSIQMKGIISQKLHNDYSGEVKIEHTTDKNAKCIITFIEEGKELGKFEGKIYDGEKVVYLIGGNWTKEIYYTDPEGKNKEILLSVPTEDYIKNNNEKYVIPTYTSNLNVLDGKLKLVLPKCDSRLRPDMREYENGNIDKATEIKEKLEAKQRQRHEMFKEKNITYQPYYFTQVTHDKSGDEVYIFNGEYWKDRQNGKLGDLKDSDIFYVGDVDLSTSENK